MVEQTGFSGLGKAISRVEVQWKDWANICIHPYFYFRLQNLNAVNGGEGVTSKEA